MMENVKKRIEWIDIAKGIGMICVLIGHSESSILGNFVYLFHMPLFFFLAGYVYNDSQSNTPMKFFIKRIKSIYLPFIIYSTVFLICHNVFYRLNIYDSNITYIYTNGEFVKKIVKIIFGGVTEPMLFTFWFFTSLFTICILFNILSYFFSISKFTGKEYVRLICILLIYAIGFGTIYFNMYFPAHINTSMIGLLIYYAGFLSKKFQDVIKYNLQIAVTSLCILIISSFYGHIDMVKNIYTNPMFFIINSLCGIYLVIYCSKQLSKSKHNLNLLTETGKNTIHIMALQFLGFRLTYLYRVNVLNSTISPFVNGNNGWWIIYTISGFVISMIAAYIIKYIKRAYNDGIRKKIFFNY